jgi:nucleoside recognition membrane protein YjiH
MLGAIFGVMTLYQLCPEFIWNADTGGVNVNSFKGFDFLFFCCRIPIALTY